MAVYNYITYAQARQELANRLYDPTKVFWTDAELGAYLLEALRTWNAMTSYWRQDFVFNATQGTTWYNFINILCTLQDTWVYMQMQYHLLEPATGINPWPPSGSSQFTAADFLGAVGRRRDEILSTTACTQTQQLVPALSKRIALSDSTIDIRRVAYIPAANANPYVVWSADTWGEQAFNQNYTMLPPGLPSVYLRSTQPPITFDTDAPPGYGGNYDVLTVNAGAALSATTPSTLFIPDNWVDVLKWGALADLLSRESNAKDVLRATYCEQRYRMGMSLLQKAPFFLALRRGNFPLWLDSVRAADAFQSAWQALPQGTPVSSFYSGMNLLALSPAADAGTYSFLATFVQNAPVPVNDGDPLQAARDDLDVIIDYAQHLASFKMGGDEFTRTMSLLERFLSQAALYTLKLRDIAEFTKVLYALSTREKEMNPVMQPDTGQRGGPEE